MNVRVILMILFVLMFSTPLYAEKIDITPDLQNQLKRQIPNGNGAVRQPLQQSQPDTTGMQDIHDISPPVDVGFDKRILIFGGLIVLGLVLSGLFFWLLDRYLKKRKREPTLETPALAPDVEALQLLAALEQDRVQEPKAFYYRLTGILKGYLGRRYHTDAPEMTTEELLPVVSRMNEIAPELKEGVKSILTASDPIKYAFATVIQEQMKTDFDFVKNFIGKTTPVEDEAEAEDV